ncbi:MAG: hypothetical protein EBR82_24430 [Caulobacteraceae bacterium]|nr:hypothetical protein [Caulobacteraceae bacterium]
MENLSKKYDAETLNYLYYLRNYALNLERFLHAETEESFKNIYPEYMDATPKRIRLPLELTDALRIQDEIERVNLRIREISNFNSHD